MKKTVTTISLFATIALAYLATNNSTENIKNTTNGLIKANIEALGQNESGGSSLFVTCYTNYHDCWFWNCEKIWRCHLTNCYEVKCDEKSEKNICTNLN